MFDAFVSCVLLVLSSAHELQINTDYAFKAAFLLLKIVEGVVENRGQL